MKSLTKNDIMNRAVVFSLLILVLLAGCGNPNPTEVVGIEEQTATKEPVPTQTISPPIQERVTLTPGSDGALSILEYPILIDESVEDVLEAFSDADWNHVGSVRHKINMGEDIISFREGYSSVGDSLEEVGLFEVEIAIFRNDELMMTLPLGEGTPIPAVWGFSATEDSWFMEIIRADPIDRENGTGEIVTHGDILWNGESFNEKHSYSQSFGFSLISGKPFYFFERNGIFGYSYDGYEYPLPYTEISHHHCCSAGLANPRGSENGVVIFANQGDQRYLVMIGDI